MSDSGQPQRWQPTRLPRPWDSPGKNTRVGCHSLLLKVKSESEVAQLCPTLRDPMGCSLPGSSVHGIFQARVLEWGAIAFSDKVQEDHPKYTSQNSSIRGHLYDYILAQDRKYSQHPGNCASIPFPSISILPAPLPPYMKVNHFDFF